MSSVKEIMFKKRSGTSGICGQLYETKLISLILFKLLHDDRFEYFYLASNIDEIGCFDDLCFKVKIKGIDRPLLVFMQTKHKDDDNSYVNFDEVKEFQDSYTKVVRKFNLYKKIKQKSNDNIFNGNFDEHDCIFILYTNARYKHDSGIDFNSAYANTLNYLLATGKSGTLLHCTEKIIEESAETILREEITSLAEHFVKFLDVNESLQIMFDYYILQYHVILTMKVVEVSEIQSDEQNSDLKWRVLTFREEFFETNDKYFKHLKKTICKLILHNRANIMKSKKPAEDSKLKEQLSNFFEKPSAKTLSSLIGTHIQYTNGRLEFISPWSSEIEVQKLEQINISQIIVEEAEATAAKDILLSLKLRVPPTFGNKDLIICESRLDQLTKSVINLCKKNYLTNSYKIVTLDETIEKELLDINGGLAGAVGNVLVHDENIKLLKFVDNSTPLQNNARILLEKLRMNMTNLHEYRFDVKALLLFPKLSFNCYETAKQTLHNLVIYAQQGDQNRVETILKKEIENYHNTNGPHIQFQPDIIFRNFHSNVQAWWLLINEASYITKDSEIYKEAINSIIFEPQINSLNYMFDMTNMKNIEYTKESLESLRCLLGKNDVKDQLLLATRTVIVTNVSTLTAIKVIQYLRNKGIKNYAIFNLDAVIKLSTEGFCALKTELRKTDKVIIIICDNLQCGKNWYEKYLKEIAQEVEEKQKVLITNGIYVELVQHAFSISEKEEIIYETQNLADMTQASQRNIIKNGNIVFQGQVMSLDLFLDDTTVSFIEETVLNKIILNDTIELGDSLSDPNYEEISHLYQERTVEYIKSHLVPGNICVSTVEDLDYLKECRNKNIIPNQQGDQLIDSFFSINFLEDSYNLTYGPDSDDINKHFQFVCSLNPEKKTFSKDAVDFIVVVNVKDGSTITSRITIKKKDIASKVWVVNIKLLNCSKQLKNWQKDETMVKNTLKTFKYMCQRVVLDHIIRNENIEIRNIADDLNKKTSKSLLNEFNEEDLQHIFPCADSNKQTTVNNIIPNVVQNEGGSNITVNDEQQDAVYNIMLIESFAESFFKLIPIITVSSNDLDDDSDDAINNGQKDIHNDSNVSRNLENDYSLSESGDKNIYNFNIRFCCKHRIELKTFDDIKDDVVILTAAPGLGKSTLLTHLSNKVKKLFKNIWVVRINLLNYSGEFRTWQQNKNIVIDTSKTLKLMCQVVLKNKNITVDLKESCNKIYLDRCSGNEWDRFHLNMFLHYYNERNMLFIFDGFDEVCPDYKYEAFKFLNVIKNNPQKNKIWITSRPYNEILPTLVRHLGRLFRIEYLNKSKQTEYLGRFWEKSNIKQLYEYDVQTLLNFISQVITAMDVKLQIVCYDFFNYIVTKFQLHEVLSKEPEIRLYIERIEEVHKNMDRLICRSLNSEVNTFLGTPLLLHLTAEFFVTEVLDIPKVCNKGQLVFSIITMYEKIIQIKLKKILFNDKCRMNTDIPHINKTYELELKECMTLHKKLGAHAIFGSPLFQKNSLYFEEFHDMAPFNFDNASGMAEFKVAINRILNGNDKTGLVYYVTDDGTPVFIHKTFAEYFAVEYISDILKNTEVEYNTKKLLLTVILAIIHSEIVNDDHGNMITSGVSTWVQEKCIVDDGFKSIGVDLMNNEPLIKKYDGLCSVVEGNILKRAFIRLINSTSDDFENASFREDNIEEYLSRRRELDDNLFLMMKPHFKKKFPIFSKHLYYRTWD